MSEKPYELPLKNVKTPLCFAIKDNYVGNGYYLELVDGDGDMFVLDIETEIIDIISAKFDDILTAVNAYPALVAENERMRKAIDSVIGATNLFDSGTQDMTQPYNIGFENGYSTGVIAMKNILLKSRPALEKGGE